jgi:hypothetical protein
MGGVGFMGFDLAGENVVRGLGVIFAKGARECIEFDRRAEWRIERAIKCCGEVCGLWRVVFFGTIVFQEGLIVELLDCLIWMVYLRNTC